MKNYEVEEIIQKIKIIKKICCRFKYNILIFIFFFLVFSFIKINNVQYNRYIIKQQNKIINENFFVIDKNNLKTIKSHMYGFSISKKGILTNNYYEKLGYYEDPDPLGTYIMIRRIGHKIRIYQDFYGCYGLYIYENKETKYFALSNSFLMLEEYLIGKENISLNKDFADNFIISKLCSPSIHETLINEIIKLPANIIINLDIKKKEFNYIYIDYKENTIPISSAQGLNIIDEWVDKWGYILRSLSKQTDNLSFDLSGGFDTRTVLSILISSGINLNETFIKSAKDKKNPDHFEDFQIATNISSKFGFKLNNFYLDNQSISWSTNDTLFCSMYTKLGFHKEFYLKSKYFKKPRFIFTGNGGENIRGYPGYPIKKYIEGISSQGRRIFSDKKNFYFSSKRLCERSVNLMKRNNIYENEFEISSDFYSKGRTRNHYGKSAVEGFLANIYFIQPLLDPDIKKIKYNISQKWSHDLIAYIYCRFAHDLIYFPIQGNRTINKESVKKAEYIIYNKKPYTIKSDFNTNFYIDIKRKCPVPPSNINQNADNYLKKLFETSNFIQNIKKIYDQDIYDWAINYTKNSNFFPLRYGYGLLAISITLDYLNFNKKLLKNKSKNDKIYKGE